MKIWDIKIGKHIETPVEMDSFFNDLDIVFKRHNMSISHEDTHGAFIITEYDDDCVDWLRMANKGY